MLHVTCDLCGRELRPGADHHFVVKIEVYSAHDPCELTEEDLDDDHMQAVSQLLRDEETLDEPGEREPAHTKFRYDLCSECQQRFRKDPLNREVDPRFDFSEN